MLPGGFWGCCGGANPVVVEVLTLLFVMLGCWTVGVQVSLEVEYNNTAALKLYTNLGLMRTKLLAKYYLNGSDAYRMRLAFT